MMTNRDRRDRRRVFSLCVPRFPGIALALSLAFAVGLPAAQAAENDYTLTLKNNEFVSDALSVPAGQPFTLKIVNADAAPEEFESPDLHVEKLVAGSGEVTLRFGPLDPGTYSFFGDFHQSTAHGVLMVEAAQ